MEAAEAIALVKGHIEHELLLRNEYLAAENEIHDRDGKFCPAFDGVLKSAGKELVKLPARSPDL